MSKSFFDASGYSELTTFDAKDSETTLSNLINSGWLLTDGKHSMLGFVVFPMFMNSKTTIAQELFWWVDEEARKTGAGIKILKQTEKLAKEHGAEALMMLSLSDLNGKKIGKLYESLGYKQKEQTYMRVL